MKALGISFAIGVVTGACIILITRSQLEINQTTYLLFAWPMRVAAVVISQYSILRNTPSASVLRLSLFGVLTFVFSVYTKLIVTLAWNGGGLLLDKENVQMTLILSIPIWIIALISAAKLKRTLKRPASDAELLDDDIA